MKNPLLSNVCDQCGRGMIPNIRMMVGRCYACLRQCDRHGQWLDFDPTGEDIRVSPDEVVHAMLAESLALRSQKELAARMNVTPQFLSDVLNSRRAISDVISKYYWLDRVCWFVPRFSTPQEASK